MKKKTTTKGIYIIPKDLAEAFEQEENLDWLDADMIDRLSQNNSDE